MTLVAKMMKRLNDEIERLEAQEPEKQMYLWGKYVGMAYMRAIFCQMIAAEGKEKEQKPMSEAEILKMLNDLWQERIKEREDKTE